MPDISAASYRKTTDLRLLIALVLFLVAFPWIAQLLPHEIREYIGILFR